MFTNEKWGEYDYNEDQSSYLQNINFSPIIELAMQNLTDTPPVVKPSIVELPIQNLATHTIALQQHSRHLSDILDQAYDGARINILSLPPIPETPPQSFQHDFRRPIPYMDKEYCDFSRGIGPKVLPLNPSCHQRALKQCAAIALAQIGVLYSTRSVIDNLSDALDHYMRTMTMLMRSIVDREASGISSGFPDVISKVFSELGVTDLHSFYQNRVVKYHNKMLKECQDLSQKCHAMAIPELAPQLKLEDVPELHFPAALSEVFTPSLEPGFQMLHSLEQEELQGLELLDTVSQDDMKIEIVEYTQPEPSPSMSPRSKKKRK